jgi:cellobiose phosphorylase
MRGTRDSAQDANALPPLAPGACRETLLNIFSTQRSDGWFLRQYSTQGRHGRHDTRSYVDGGVWVWEFLYDYLCWTKDFKLLEAKVPYLDDDTEAPILEHAERLLSYYTRPENLGEHGLTLIRGGDWNDALNAAGLLGRGESVMVSCQAVLALAQASTLMDFLGRDGAALLQQGREMKSNILKHALNEEGYLNGVFTDRGEWVFSPHDPDGRRRVSVPVNAFGIISGVLQGNDARRALDVLQSMKGRDGWPLFHPAISDPPIEKLGRLGHGDLAPGLCENAAVYNHGSHGFLGRAAAAAGDGGMLLETLRYMLPYDQARHPVERTCTAPYGVVNY